MESETGLKLILWIGTIIMIFLALGVLLITLLYQKKVYKIRKNEADNLLKTTLDTEKRERQRIASDLHDGVAGDLNAIRNYITILYQKEQNPTNKPLLKEVKLSLDNMLANIKAISYNLMPPLLDTMGLEPTLNDYFDRVKKLNNITVTAHYPQNPISVSSSVAYDLYRIVQELISNIIKHSDSSHINFFILIKGNILEIYISDDGIPYDFYKSLKSSTGMGLKNILSRIKHLEANLEQVPLEKGNEIIIRLKNIE